MISQLSASTTTYTLLPISLLTTPSTGEFAFGKVDPHEAGAKGGHSSGGGNGSDDSSSGGGSGGGQGGQSSGGSAQ